MKKRSATGDQRSGSDGAVVDWVKNTAPAADAQGFEGKTLWLRSFGDARRIASG